MTVSKEFPNEWSKKFKNYFLHSTDAETSGFLGHQLSLIVKKSVKVQQKCDERVKSRFRLVSIKFLSPSYR